MRLTLPNTGSCAGLYSAEECSVMWCAHGSRRMGSQIFVGQQRFNRLRNCTDKKQACVPPAPQHIQKNVSITRKKYFHCITTQRM